MTDNTVYTVVSSNDRPGTANSDGFFEKNAVMPNTPGASIDNTTYGVTDTVNGSGAGNGTGSFYEKNSTIETLVFSDNIVAEITAQTALSTTNAASASASAAAAAASASAAAASAAASAAAAAAASGTATPLVAGTAAVGTSTKWAHEDHVHPTDTSRAPVASPTFTGVPAAPTPAALTDNSTTIPTTAWIQSLLSQSPTNFGPLTLTPTSGSFTSTATTVAQYLKIGKMMLVSWDFTTLGGSGFIDITMPTTFSSMVLCSAFEVQQGLGMATANTSSSTQLRLKLYNNGVTCNAGTCRWLGGALLLLP